MKAGRKILLFSLAITLVFSGGAAVGIYSDSMRNWVRPPSYGWEHAGVDIPWPKAPMLDGPSIYVERMTKETNVGIFPREKYIREHLPEVIVQGNLRVILAGSYGPPKWIHSFRLSHPDAVLRVEEPVPGYWTIYEDDNLIFEISRQTRYEPIDERKRRRVYTWKVSHSTFGWPEPIPSKR